MVKNTVIRIKCADQKGLIAGISGVLYNNGSNIVVMREFVDPATNIFYARLEIDNEFSHGLQEQLTQTLPEGSEVSIIPVRKKKIIVFVTREHHCLSDLLVRHFFDELNADILAVIGNYNVLEAFTARFNIPFHFIDHNDKDQQDYEERMLEVIRELQPDYLVLAKFMRILSPSFVSNFENRIINIHHSFLPAFKGANPYKRAFERGVKLIGATAHIVNDQLDEGPIITQKIIPVNHNDDLWDMIEAGHEIEKSVLADALKMMLEDRIFVSNNKTIVFS